MKKKGQKVISELGEVKIKMLRKKRYYIMEKEKCVAFSKKKADVATKNNCIKWQPHRHLTKVNRHIKSLQRF